MLDAESEENCAFTGNWCEEEVQRAFDKIKFANCFVNDAVSKEQLIMAARTHEENNINYIEFLDKL